LSSRYARVAIKFLGTKNRKIREFSHQTPWWCLKLQDAGFEKEAQMRIRLRDAKFSGAVGALHISFTPAHRRRQKTLLDDSKAAKTPADITAEATRYTVLLECLK
jgi:hypothetical protein